MRNKSFITAALAAAILTSGLFAGQALARPHMGYGYHNGGSYSSMYDSLSPEKQKQYDAIIKDYMDKTQDLRDKLQAKRIELDTLGNSTNPNPEAVGKASQELVSLRNQLRKEHAALSERLSKELGVNFSRGRYGDCPGGCGGNGGYGPGMMGGRGMMDGDYNGMGRGHRHGGYGYHDGMRNF